MFCIDNIPNTCPNTPRTLPDENLMILNEELNFFQRRVVLQHCLQEMNVCMRRARLPNVSECKSHLV